ncbi:MAG: phage tail tape measure protein [Janthinobacterium lividum]
MAENPIKFADFFDPLGPGANELKDFTTAIQGLSRNYKAFAKNLDADGERVKAVLAGISAQSVGLREQATSINLLNEKERAGMAALTAEAMKLVQERQRLEKVLAAQAAAQNVVQDATKQATSAFRALQNELREAYAAADTARIDKAAAAIKQAKTETTQLSAALRGTNSELTAARGSYDALDLENKKLIASLKALGGGIEGGGAEAQKLQKQIAANTESLKSFDENILIFGRNVGNYKSGFTGLVQELAKARAAQASLTQGTEEYNRQQIKISGFQTAAQKSAAQMGLSYEQAEASITSTTAAIQPLTNSLVRLEKEQEAVALAGGRESEAFRKIGFQIESTKKKIDETAVATTKTADSTSGLTSQLGFSKAGLQQFAIGLAVSTVGLQALLQGIKAVLEANVQYSRDLAEVRKTTGLTADEAERLAESLKALDTPTSLQGLLKIASVGGQLGIAKGDLLEFTKAIDTAVQALGNDFAGGAEEIATVLGKISGVFRKELGPDAAQNILAIGSAVNQIGADGAATAPFLTDVALRVGAVAAQSGVGLKNVLAYAAVLQEMGSTAEVAGTSLNRLFSTLSSKTKESFEIARKADPSLTLKEFTHLVNTDFNAAIQLFLKGLNAGGQTTTALSKELDTLKLKSGEAKSAIITLAQNTDLFAERQKTANDQLRDATSLAAEAAINTDTLGGSVDKLKNQFSNFFSSGAGGSFLKFLVDLEADAYKTTLLPFQLIGDGIGYIKDKLGLTQKPLEDFTVAQVAKIQADLKQVDSQQALLVSYQELSKVQERSGAQELEFQQVRQKLGTDDVKQIQAGIDKRKEDAENLAQGLRDNLVTYTDYVDQAAQKVAQAQAILNRGPQVGDRGQNAQNLIDAQKDLAEQQRIRANILAALAKLEPPVTKATQDGADAADTAADAEERLDRASQERAKNRVSQLRDELSDNQKRIDAVKENQAEQFKLFADEQINGEGLRQSVGGTQELLTQYERNGAAIRIKIARAESAEKLVEADNQRIRESSKKKISEAELADIQAQYAARRAEILRQEGRQTQQINTDLQKKLVEKPLEFKVAELSAQTLKKASDAIYGPLKIAGKTYEESLTAVEGAAVREMTAVTLQFAEGKIKRQQYEDALFDIRKKAIDKTVELRDAFHIADNQQDRKAAELKLATAQRLADKRKAIAEKTANTLLTLDSYYTQFRQNALDTQIQDEQAAYETSLKTAGDNTALKTQIEANHAKEVKRLNYEKAKADRDAAVFTIAVQTAVAVAKAFAESPLTFGLPFSAIALANGLIQEALVLSKPLPAYFVGRKNGPAEFAHLGERGPELVGQERTGFRLVEKPSVGYLAAGDRVYTAPETRTILRQNELAEGRIMQRAQQADMERQTVRLRQGAAARQAEAQAAFERSNGQVLAELRQVRKAIQEQEQLRVAEGELQRWRRSGDTWTHLVNQRYKHGRG